MINEQASVIDSDLEANRKRKVLYYAYIRAVHGMLGKGVRKEIPQCILEFIRELFPDEHGEYMGHMEK